MKKRIHLSPPVYEQGVALPISIDGSVYEAINKDILTFENSIKEYL